MFNGKIWPELIKFKALSVNEMEAATYASIMSKVDGKSQLPIEVMAVPVDHFGVESSAFFIRNGKNGICMNSDSRQIHNLLWRCWSRLCSKK